MTTPIPTTEALALARELLPYLCYGTLEDSARRIDAFAQERATKLPAVLTILREKWLADVYTYPDSSGGLHASAAVVLCVRELDAAIKQAEAAP